MWVAIQPHPHCPHFDVMAQFFCTVVDKKKWVVLTASLFVVPPTPHQARKNRRELKDPWRKGKENQCDRFFGPSCSRRRADLVARLLPTLLPLLMWTLPLWYVWPTITCCLRVLIYTLSIQNGGNASSASHSAESLHKIFCKGGTCTSVSSCAEAEPSSGSRGDLVEILQEDCDLKVDATSVEDAQSKLIILWPVYVDIQRFNLLCVRLTQVKRS